MDKLNWDLRQICNRNKDGAFGTQAARWRSLDLMARELRALGFHNLRAASLKPRHIEALLSRWQAAGLAPGTLKNRLSHLRWWAEKIGKPSLLPKDNTAMGVAERRYVTNESKACALDERLREVQDPHVRLSLELQAAFGLRREEALKFQPSFADQGDRLLLKPSWTKGGRGRELPLLDARQRELLARAHQLAGRGSLIPPSRSYIEHLKIYERECARAGLHKMHGLRHAYAQARYLALTSRPCPAAGGKTSQALTPAEKALDRTARLAISRELGHEREQVTAVYLGR
jgi:Phage integrase, N-terminal/Integrase